MQQPVIAAVDPLRGDIAPVGLGLMLARLTSAPLLLAGAYPDLHFDGVSPGLTRAFGAEAEQRMSRLGALVEHAPGPRVAVATTVVASARSPARALHDLAEHHEASLFVLGSSRRGLVGRVLPGAVTDRLLHGAPCPVAVAPGGFSFDDADGGLGRPDEHALAD
jgi:nucleotide-binding universal stress UspA family protein